MSSDSQYSVTHDISGAVNHNRAPLQAFGTIQSLSGKNKSLTKSSKISSQFPLLPELRRMLKFSIRCSTGDGYVLRVAKPGSTAPNCSDHQCQRKQSMRSTYMCMMQRVSNLPQRLSRRMVGDHAWTKSIRKGCWYSASMAIARC